MRHISILNDFAISLFLFLKLAKLCTLSNWICKCMIHQKLLFEPGMFKIMIHGITFVLDMTATAQSVNSSS